MVSGILRLNDYGVMIGRRESPGEGQADWFYPIGRRGSRPLAADEKSQNCFEISVPAGGKWRSWILFKRSSIQFRIVHMEMN